MKFSMRFFVGLREFGGPYYGKIKIAFQRPELIRIFAFVCRLSPSAVELSVQKEQQPFCEFRASSPHAFPKAVERECSPEQQAIIALIVPRLFAGIGRITRQYPDSPAGRFEFAMEQCAHEMNGCTHFSIGYEACDQGIASTRQEARLLRAACA